MSDHESNARIERLERLYRFWKRLALTALALLVVGLLIGGGLIVRAYSSAAEARESAESQRARYEILIANDRALMRALIATENQIIESTKQVTRSQGIEEVNPKVGLTQASELQKPREQ
jgi:hypothetical protein